MTQKHDPLHSSANVRWQSAYWHLRLKDRQRLSAREGLRFLRWIRRSPEHLHEFLVFRRLDDLLTRLLRVKSEQSNVTHVDFWQGSSLSTPKRRAQPRWGSWSAAAAALITLSLIVFFVSGHEDRPDRIVATAAHESKTQKLEDGSEVSLGSRSTLRVQFTDLRREVQLPQGRATFNVVMDMKRPFVVNTLLVDIAAVESKFSVSMDTSVEVVVHEGMVAITAHGAKAGAAVVRVKKGETYRVSVGAWGSIVADSSNRVRAERVHG